MVYTYMYIYMVNYFFKCAAWACIGFKIVFEGVSKTLWGRSPRRPTQGHPRRPTQQGSRMQAHAGTHMQAHTGHLIIVVVLYDEEDEEEDEEEEEHEKEDEDDEEEEEDKDEDEEEEDDDGTPKHPRSIHAAPTQHPRRQTCHLCPEEGGGAVLRTQPAQAHTGTPTQGRPRRGIHAGAPTQIHQKTLWAQSPRRPTQGHPCRPTQG